MRRGTFFGIALAVAAVFFAGWFLQPTGAGRELVQYAANRGSEEFFAGSVRLASAVIDRKLRIHLRGLRGEFQSPSGPVPLEIPSADSQGPLTGFFSQEGLVLNFKASLGQPTEGRGLDGVLKLRGGKQGFFEVKADVRSLDLHEIEWVNPENLSGSAGEMKGDLLIRGDASGRPFCRLHLQVDEPGGKLQARLFDTLKPYLPEVTVRQKVEKIAGGPALVNYRKARLDLDLPESDRLKIFLHIEVPDYNLNLNLNIEVRVDSKNAFADLAGLVGLIQKEANG